MKFIVDGFPRQGNTTLIRIIKNVFENQAVNEYPSHNLSLIDQSIRDNNVILFPIRDPLSVLASFCEMQMLKFPDNRESPKNKHMLDHALKTLKSFQDYAIQNLHKMHVIRFEDIVEMSEDYKNININNNRIIKKLSKQYKLENIQRIDPLFNTFSEYSSTKNPSLEEWILADNFSEIFVKIVNNHNFLVNKSY